MTDISTLTVKVRPRWWVAPLFQASTLPLSLLCIVSPAAAVLCADRIGDVIVEKGLEIDCSQGAP